MRVWFWCLVITRTWFLPFGSVNIASRPQREGFTEETKYSCLVQSLPGFVSTRSSCRNLWLALTPVKPVAELVIFIYPHSELGQELSLKSQWTFDFGLTLHISLTWKYNVQSCAAVIRMKLFLTALEEYLKMLPEMYFELSWWNYCLTWIKLLFIIKKMLDSWRIVSSRRLADSHFSSRVTATHHYKQWHWKVHWVRNKCIK